MAKKVEVTHFICPSCGGSLFAVPGALRCRHCGYERERGTQKIEPPLEPLRQVEANREEKIFECPNCGAKTRSDSVSLLCSYCSTPLVGEFFDPLLPKGVGTIWVDPKKVTRLVKAHIRSLWFAPNAFMRSFQKAKEPKAVYYPVWSFDAKVVVRYSGWRGVRRTRMVYMGGRSQMRTTMEWQPVSGILDLHIQDIQQLGYEPFDPLIVRMRWDRSRLESVQKEALSGWEAKEYSISVLEARKRAQKGFDRVIESAIRRDIGGDAQRIGSFESEYFWQKFLYFLAPFYHIQLYWRKRRYDYFVNAQNGEVVGERPYSWIKIALFVLFILAGVAALYFLDQWLQTHHHISFGDLL